MEFREPLGSAMQVGAQETVHLKRDGRAIFSALETTVCVSQLFFYNKSVNIVSLSSESQCRKLIKPKKEAVGISVCGQSIGAQV